MKPFIVEFIEENNLTCWKNKNDHQIYYCGNWWKGKADGVGLSFIEGKYYYFGSFEYGLPHGGGTMTMVKSKAVYDGNFEDGKAHGRGVYKNKK